MTFCDANAAREAIEKLNRERWSAEDFDDMQKRMLVLSDEGHSLADDWADMAAQAAADLRQRGLCDECEPVAWRCKDYLPWLEGKFAWRLTSFRPAPGTECEPLYTSPSSQQADTRKVTRNQPKENTP